VNEATVGAVIAASMQHLACARLAARNSQYVLPSSQNGPRVAGGKGKIAGDQSPPRMCWRPNCYEFARPGTPTEHAAEIARTPEEKEPERWISSSSPAWL
jgi:hypothetical protein